MSLPTLWVNLPTDLWNSNHPLTGMWEDKADIFESTSSALKDSSSGRFYDAYINTCTSTRDDNCHISGSLSAWQIFKHLLSIRYSSALTLTPSHGNVPSFSDSPLEKSFLMASLGNTSHKVLSWICRHTMQSGLWGEHVSIGVLSIYNTLFLRK